MKKMMATVLVLSAAFAVGCGDSAKPTEAVPANGATRNFGDTSALKGPPPGPTGMPKVNP